MSTYDWSATCDDIVTRALKRMGKVGRGEVPTTPQLSDGRQIMNAMVKSWQAKKVFLWALNWQTQVITASSQVTGTDGLIYSCIRSHTSATATNKPITGTEYTSYWAENGATGGAWANSTSYSCAGEFDAPTNTIAVERAFLRDGTTDIPLVIIDRATFLEKVDHMEFNDPTYLYFDKQVTPKIYLRPIPDDVTKILHLSLVKKLADFDTGSGAADFPVEWTEALISGLTYRWAREFGIGDQTIMVMKAEAMEAFIDAQRSNQEYIPDNFITGAFSD